MSESTTQAAPDTSSTSAPAQGLATETTTTTAPVTQETTQQTTTAPATGLDFIPENYRNEPWAQKYKTPDDFYKGVANMAKLVGQKQIVNGVQVPGENATPEEINAFYNQIGRPESADKYELPDDIQFHEGLDPVAEKKAVAELSHELGLTNKQTVGLLKKYADIKNEEFKNSEAKVKETFDKAVVTAFGTDYQANLGLAKKAAKTYGWATTLDNEGLSASPIVLKALAELGKFVGEDSKETGSSETKESLEQEALRLQKSPEYKTDKAIQEKVREIYRKVYPD